MTWAFDAASDSAAPAREVVCAKIIWVKGPFQGNNSLRIEFQSDITRHDFNFDAMMPDMGHGLGTPPRMIHTTPRVIEISELILFMGGRWLLKFQLDAIDRTIELDL